MKIPGRVYILALACTATTLVSMPVWGMPKCPPGTESTASNWHLFGPIIVGAAIATPLLVSAWRNEKWRWAKVLTASVVVTLGFCAGMLWLFAKIASCDRIEDVLGGEEPYEAPRLHARGQGTTVHPKTAADYVGLALNGSCPLLETQSSDWHRIYLAVSDHTRSDQGHSGLGSEQIDATLQVGSKNTTRSSKAIAPMPQCVETRLRSPQTSSHLDCP